MKVNNIHSWNLTYSEAIELQKKCIEKLTFPKFKGNVSYIAGVDISCSKGDPRLFGAVVILKVSDLSIVEVATGYEQATFPYIPGLLSFRELPLLCKIFEKVSLIPDIVVCDGQGIAHPRSMGIASHLGLCIDIPTIGCAKKRLVGDYGPVGKKKWSQSDLVYRDNVVGAVVRTRENVKPVFISPGNQIDLENAVEILKMCTTKYRLPEPTRLAHKEVNILRKQFS